MRRGLGHLLSPVFTAGLIFLVSTPAAHAVTDEIVGATNGKVYHTQSRCTGLKRTAPENRVVFKSIAEAEAEGRRLCKICERMGDSPRTAGEDAPGKSGNKPRKAGGSANGPNGADVSDVGEQIKVKVVVGGGTIVLESGDRIALVGIGVPLDAQDASRTAQEKMIEKLAGRTVTLIRAESSEVNGGRDGWGRIPGYVRVEPANEDLGETLLAAGLAWVDRTYRHERRKAYLDKEGDAFAKGLGIWKRLDGKAGRLGVWVGRHALEYHPAGCPHMVQLTEPLEIPLNEAKARRLTPCDRFVLPGSNQPGEPKTHEEKSDK